MAFDLALGIYKPAAPTPEQPLTGLDIESAHAKAGELLAVEVPAERAVLTSQAIALLLGGLAPVIGAAGFHWTLGPILLAIAIDDAAALVADILKMLLGETAFTREIDRRRLAANTWMLARLSARVGRLPLAWSPHPCVERPVLPVLFMFGTMGPLYTGTFLVIMLVFVDWRALPGWPLLFLPLLTRLLPACRVALRARAGRPCPQVMPSGWLPASASILAVLAYALCAHHGWTSESPLAYTAWYFGVCALFAATLAWSRWRREADLRAFAQRDIAPAVAVLRTARFAGPLP